jgi:conjugal transfer pilus assembly protein TraV
MRVHYLIIAALAAGCQPLTGIIGASESFACRAPDGVACSSVSGVHANLQAHNLPFQRQRAANAPVTPSPTGTALTVPAAGDPLRSAGRTLRIWLAPWIDSDNTLHDQAFLYTQVSDDRWRIGELRQRITAPPRKPAVAPQFPAQTPALAETIAPQANQPRPLAEVRTDSAAQAAARTTVDATRHQEKRP